MDCLPAEPQGKPSGKAPTCQCRRHKRRTFESWVGKIPWRRKWQPTRGFLPGESHGQRSLVGYSLWGCKESDMTESNLARSTWGPSQYKTRKNSGTFRGGPKYKCWRSWSWTVLWQSPRPSRTQKKDAFFIIGDWNAKAGSQVTITWSNSQVWPWSTNEAGQRLTEFCQENALVIANTLFQQTRDNSTHGHHQMVNIKSDWFYFLQPKVETLYAVSKNKT